MESPLLVRSIVSAQTGLKDGPQLYHTPTLNPKGEIPDVPVAFSIIIPVLTVIG